MNVREMKQKLRSIESVTFSKHFKKKSDVRNIEQGYVLLCLKDPKNLEIVEDPGKERAQVQSFVL
jgi:hypothetical protein